MFAYLMIGRDYKLAKFNGGLPTWYAFGVGCLAIECSGYYLGFLIFTGG